MGKACKTDRDLCVHSSSSPGRVWEQGTDRRLIVNADGFGIGPGATQGIIDAVSEGGFITSVSVNANFQEAERIRELAAKFPRLSVGVHVNPIAGPPCLPPKDVPSLVGPNGCLHGTAFYRLWRQGKISPAELEAELNAQIGRIKEWVGNRLTHIDSHQNSHLHYLGLFLRLAKKWRIPCMRTNASLICLEAKHPLPARLRAYLRQPQVLCAHLYRRIQMTRARCAGMRMADRLITVGYAGVGNKSVAETWQRVLRNLPRGTYEIYCHPAYPDVVLRSLATYVEPRRQELDILRRPELAEIARAEGVQLISFFDLL